MEPTKLEAKVAVQWEPGLTLKELEHLTIIACLTIYGGNRTKAARALGVSKRTITNKINQYKAQGHQVPERPDPRSFGGKKRKAPAHDNLEESENL